MALVTGPLLSLDARGKMGGALVFSNWKGRPTVRKLVTPSNPQTGAQTGQRAMMGFLSRAWAGLSDGNKAAWATLADEGKYSNFNAFTKFNLNQWTQFATPKMVPTANPATAPVMGTLTATGGVRQISISQVVTTPNGLWGTMIAVSLESSFTPAKSDVMAISNDVSSPVTYTISGLAAGTYYVRTAGFNANGDVSAWSSEEEVTVT